ncbi:hypothetical protein ZWY2020_020294 [Hordeum vulgare]|nr:hypothetical protein ZWY2020_020294 [Hordeum vulgare]
MEVGGEEFAVGVVISAKTTLGEESQEGMGRAERGERRNVRVLKANYIQEFSLVGEYDDPLYPASCVLDLAAIHAREEATLSRIYLLFLAKQGAMAKYGYCPYDLDTRSTRKLVLQIPRSSAISLLQKIRQLGGIAIMHTLVACLHQTEPEQRVLAAKLFLQLDMLQQQIKSKIGPRAAVVVSARQERNDAIVELREKQGKNCQARLKFQLGLFPGRHSPSAPSTQVSTKWSSPRHTSWSRRTTHDDEHV